MPHHWMLLSSHPALTSNVSDTCIFINEVWASCMTCSAALGEGGPIAGIPLCAPHWALLELQQLSSAPRHPYTSLENYPAQPRASKIRKGLTA